MANKSPKIPEQKADPVNNLLRLPQKGLEARIARLRADIAYREDLRDQLITGWNTRQTGLEDRVNRLKYAAQLPAGLQSKKDAEAQILRIQNMQAQEFVSAFRDLLELREKLETAIQELEAEREKLKLLDS